MANQTSEAVLDWLMYLGIFLVFGGLGAGVVTLLFQAIIGQEFNDVLYAVIFGGSGLIAYDVVRYIRRP